jgi:CheY-like chemotaxis protein
MPHKTGEKLYWELRKDANYRELPIMIVTGYAKLDKPTINFHEFIHEKGIPEPDAFLEKPIDPVKTVDTAIRVLSSKIPAKELT